MDSGKNESGDIVLRYRRQLPHFQVKGCTMFITWRNAFTLPESILQSLSLLNKEYEEKSRSLSQRYQKFMYAQYQRKRFDAFDEAIGALNAGATDLSKSPIDEVVPDILYSNDGVYYDLIAFCVMPNHVHLIITPLLDDSGNYFKYDNIMQTIKQSSAARINAILGKSGQIWMHESYDRIIRNDRELNATISYLVQNPVKTGLVKDGIEWKYNYVKGMKTEECQDGKCLSASRA